VETLAGQQLDLCPRPRLEWGPDVVVAIDSSRTVKECAGPAAVTFAHLTATSFFCTEGALSRLRAKLGDRPVHGYGDYDNGRQLGPMTPEHPRWTEFVDRLTGPEGCDFRPDEVAGATWNCDGDAVGRAQERPGDDADDTPDGDAELTWSHSRRILAHMGATVADVEASLAYFAASGGCCDCEVVVKVAGYAS
jgi:hypothetical protein